MKSQPVNIRVLASLIQGKPFGVREFTTIDLLQFLFSEVACPENPAPVAREILKAQFPFLNAWSGRTEEEQERWINSIIAHHGSSLPVEPLKALYYAPGLFPDDEQCRSLIQAFKERRWALLRDYARTDPTTAANLYAVIRGCITRSAPF